jgi:ATP-dependent DNA helicase RecG
LTVLRTGIKLPSSGFVTQYKIPERVIKEAITNAVIHRDYYMKRDIEINIYEDRVEVQSPGLFPYNITPSNIGIVRAEGYRNDLLVKHLREFPDPPNLDRNEGVRAMRAEMAKHNLYPPVYITYPYCRDSVCCVLFNSKRASEWDKVYSYLSKQAKYVVNEDVRKIIGNADTVKVSRLLKKWVDRGLLIRIDTGAKKTAKYRLPSGEMIDFLFAESKSK